MNPFSQIADTAHARTLAHCVLAAQEAPDVWPALRAARRLTGHDVGRYLEGCHFNRTWCDDSGEPFDIDALRIQAANFLGEEY